MELDMKVHDEQDLETDELQMSMGPQHPATHGVLRLAIRTDGEIVTGLKSFIGYLHRCFEKHAEALEYPQVIPYTDRMDYLSAITQEHAYVLSVEKLMGDDIEVPERAKYIRTICAELQRIRSHLLAWGQFGMDAGAVTPFMHAYREQERIIDLLEQVSGARLLYHYIRIGGLFKDPSDEWFDNIRTFLDDFEHRLEEYHELLTYNQIFLKRTADVGILPTDVAKSEGATGPVLRASGVDYDTRRDDPYEIYDRFDFEVPTGRDDVGTLGDSWDRYWVRIREMEESVRIIKQALEDCPDDGDIMAKAGERSIEPSEGEAYVNTESARGELGFYIRSDGTKSPRRVKARSPGFCNLQTLNTIAPGSMISDLVVIIASLDPVFGEVDR
ncbi:MAG: NADH-quinone oxidoreductase subunit D [bacterium]